MKRDFWNGIRPLGHVTLLALSEDFWMTTLYAKGRKLGTMKPVFLWGHGNYKYEIEACKNKFYTECEVFESSYEDAMIKFEKMVDKVVLLWYNELNLESIPNGLSYIAELLSGLILSLLFWKGRKPRY